MTAAAFDATAAGAALLVAGAWLGSLLPDADKTGTRVYRATRLERRVWPLRLLGWFARIPLRLLVMLPHRGITHSLVACVAVTVAAGFLTSLVAPTVATELATGVAIGYAAHIAADACTPGGVALFAPLSKKRRRLVPRAACIPTGSAREAVVAALLTVTAVTATVLLAG